MKLFAAIVNHHAPRSRRGMSPELARLRAPLALIFILSVGVIGCDSLAYNKAKKQDAVVAYEKYLSDHPKGAHRAEALARIEALAFDEAKARDELDLYLAFVKRFPESRRRLEIEDRLDDLEFQKAAATESVEALQAYLDQRPAGLHLQDAQTLIADLRARLAIAGQEIDAAEKFLTDYPSHPQVSSVRARLIELLTQRWRDAAGEEKKSLAEKIMRWARDVCVEVQAESWYEKPEGAEAYLEDLYRQFETEGFTLAPNRDAAHLRVSLTVTEQKGKTYFNQDETPIGAATEIVGALEVRHLLLDQVLFVHELKYVPPFNLELEIYDPKAELQTELYQKAVRQFRDQAYYRYAAAITRLLLGDTAACDDFYEALKSNDRTHRQMARNFLVKGGCSPQGEHQQAALAIANNEQDRCVKLGDKCSDAICDLLLEEIDKEGAKVPESFEWLPMMGEAGARCLCRLLGETLAYDGLVDFVQVRSALIKADPAKAKACMQGYVADPTPEWLAEPEREAERLRYQRRIETLEKSVEAMEKEVPAP